MDEDKEILNNHMEYWDEHILGWYGLMLPVLLEIERYNEENTDDKAEVYVK